MPSNKKEKQCIASMKHKLSELSATETKHSIYRVHEQLRNVNVKAYEPEIIAIGPYHRGKHNLRKMEEHKWRYLHSLLEETPNVDVGACFLTIKQLEQKASDCYVEPNLLNKENFVEMLVLDGCFIIELVRKFSSRDKNCEKDPIFQMRWIMSSLQRDLILFENQIPFFVLCKLFDLIEGADKHELLIKRLFYFFPNLDSREKSRTSEQPSMRMKEFSQKTPVENIKHLLHLAYHSVVSINPMKSGEESESVSITIESGPLEREQRFIHCATKLKDAGVQFKIKEEDDTMDASVQSGTEKKDNTLFAIKFKNGKMQMPPLTIEHRTECLFRNLIAYELYFPSDHGNIITDYVKFLDCLINSWRDVEILSEEGIIENQLEDDKTIARILNKLAISISGPDRKFHYAEMFGEINRHYKSPWNRSMAMLWGKVLYSPWTKISFAAATALLALTITQTVFAIV